jgi:hypothetical protein
MSIDLLISILLDLDDFLQCLIGKLLDQVLEIIDEISQVVLLYAQPHYDL